MSATTRKTVGIFGFTIVELLIVIVVIAILATISIVAYNGIQARANDAKIRQAVAQVEKAMRLYSVDNGTNIRGGYNSTAVAAGNPCIDGVHGFFGSGAYACTVEDTLVANGLLQSGLSASLPPNSYYATTTGNGRYNMMLYGCGAVVGRYTLYWTLQRPSVEDTSSLDDTVAACGHTMILRDTYGMRAAKIIQL